MADDLFGLIGVTIERRYRVDRVVGEGGFGVVYQGWHLAFDHAVAIKCLKVPAHFTPEAQKLFLKKFREEGAFLSRLGEHSSIVRVFDLDVTTSPRVASVPYLVLEWLEGEELEQLMGQRRADGRGGFGETEALTLISPAIEAIALAHSHKIAHRDLKPANLFLTRTAKGQRIKVLDFGIAKAMQEGETATQLTTKTSSGFSAFSPKYGAPEQFHAKRYGTTGPWTDVHALGLMLTELLSGKPPYDGEELVDFYEQAAANDRPTPRSRGAAVSDELEAVVAKAVALQPKERYADAEQLLAALAALGDAGKRPGGETSPFPATLGRTLPDGPAPLGEGSASYRAQQAPRAAESNALTVDPALLPASSANPSRMMVYAAVALFVLGAAGLSLGVARSSAKKGSEPGPIASASISTVAGSKTATAPTASAVPTAETSFELVVEPPTQLVEGDDVLFRFKTTAPAWLVVYCLEERGPGEVILPSPAEHEPQASPDKPAEFPSAAERAHGTHIKATLGQPGQPARETLVSYAFADKADFDRFKPAIGASSGNGAAMEAQFKARIQAVPQSRWARTVVHYEIQPKPKAP